MNTSGEVSQLDVAVDGVGIGDYLNELHFWLMINLNWQIEPDRYFPFKESVIGQSWLMPVSLFGQCIYTLRS